MCSVCRRFVEEHTKGKRRVFILCGFIHALLLVVDIVTCNAMRDDEMRRRSSQEEIFFMLLKYIVVLAKKRLLGCLESSSGSAHLRVYKGFSAFIHFLQHKSC